MPAQQLRPGDVVAKSYEIESRLGNGPVGSTYAARVIDSDRKVALKYIDGPPAEPQLLQETLRRMGEVRSEGVVESLKGGVWQDHTYVVAEYVENDSLRKLMDHYSAQRRAFTLQEAGQIVVKILDALDAIHQAGLVHLQLKPSNILVHTRTVGPGSGRAVHTPRITGLGMAVLVDPATFQINLADGQDGRYQAPDVGAATRQADIYSVGVMLYELLCGQTPMGSYLSPSQVRDDLPAKIDDIVNIALAVNAEDRYPTARDMMNDIQRLFQEDEAVPVAPTSNRRLYLMVGGAAVVVVGLAAALFLQNPLAQAKNKDAALRASVVKSNPKPPDDVIQQKLADRGDMVWIPEGSFIHGRMNAEKVVDPSEPVTEVKKVGAFYIDRFEWPNAQGEHPQVKITWDDAKAQCESVGKRLCTSLEWERACKGPESLIFPYGDEFDPSKCGPDIAVDSDKDGKSDHVSGSLPDCKSGFGVFDQSGGPREWTATPGTNKTNYQIKGGRRGINPTGATRCTWADEQRPGLADSTSSFRCCVDDVPAGATPTGSAPAGEAPTGTPPAAPAEAPK